MLFSGLISLPQVYYQSQDNDIKILTDKHKKHWPDFPCGGNSVLSSSSICFVFHYIHGLSLCVSHFAISVFRTSCEGGISVHFTFLYSLETQGQVFQLSQDSDTVVSDLKAYVLAIPALYLLTAQKRKILQQLSSNFNTLSLKFENSNILKGICL